nr:MAG TPA: hypothetical protein [Caudoviricetes sp.]
MPLFSTLQTIDNTTFLIHGCAFHMFFLLILNGIPQRKIPLSQYRKVFHKTEKNSKSVNVSLFL